MARKRDDCGDDNVPAEHGWAERQIRHAGDMCIRAAGFRIHSRPKHGETIWSDTAGALWTQAEVSRYLNRKK